MSAFDDALDILLEVRHAARAVDTLAVGEQETIPIPDAQKVNALLLRGKAGKRGRIVAFVIEGEK